MKSKIIDEIKEILSQGLNLAKLEIEYVKLTAAEKLIILMSTLILGAICMLFLLPVLIMLLFALAGVFRLFMTPPLAYLSVGGIVVFFLCLVFLLRRPLIITPVAKFISKLFLDRNHTSHS